MTNKQYEEKFILKIGRKVIFGIIKKEVTVLKTIIVFNKDDGDI